MKVLYPGINSDSEVRKRRQFLTYIFIANVRQKSGLEGRGVKVDGGKAGRRKKSGSG